MSLDLNALARLAAERNKTLKAITAAYNDSANLLDAAIADAILRLQAEAGVNEEQEIDITALEAFMTKASAWIVKNDTQIVFKDAGPLAGVADGSTAIAIDLQITDGDGTIDDFNGTATVEVASTGSAVIAESMPIAFVEGVATVNVTNAVAESVTLSLSGGNTSLDRSDTLVVIFA